MSITGPTLNLVCNIFKQHDLSTGPPTAVPTYPNVECNLQFGKKTHGQTFGGHYILLPKGTDVQDRTNTTPQTVDLIECPSGSQRFYVVVEVDDVSKGFPTEYRTAECEHAHESADASYESAWLWPTPYP